MSANAASEALQSGGTDLAAAANAVEMLIEFAENMRTEEEFGRVAAAASKTCENLGIPLSGSGTKRKKSRPAVLQDCVMDRFLTTSSEAVA